MSIKVYNENNLVFTGNSNQFLADNDYDEYVTDKVNLLRNADEIVFSDMHIGSWRIQKVA